MKQLLRRFSKLNFKNCLSHRIPFQPVCYYRCFSMLHSCGSTNKHLMKRFTKCFIYSQVNYVNDPQTVNGLYDESDHSSMNSKSKTRQPVSSTDAENSKICNTYATADHFRFSKLVDYISLDVRLHHITLPIDVANAALFMTNDETITNVKENGYVVFFKEGAISFWNISDKMTRQIMDKSQMFEVESYSRALIQQESEQMEYKLVSGKSRFHKNAFDIEANKAHENMCSDIFAFSNALMTSVKLAHWEQSLDTLILSIESLPRALMKGRYLRSYSPKLVLSKIGEIFMIRHRLNLKYHMLEVPDVYWDEEDLENLYVKTTEYLNIQRRVKVMNEKLTYCAHVVELVKSHMAEQKSIRIEILIVLLILIEVIFELIHFYVKPFLQKQKEKR